MGKQGKNVSVKGIWKSTAHAIQLKKALFA